MSTTFTQFFLLSFFNRVWVCLWLCANALVYRRYTHTILSNISKADVHLFVHCNDQRESFFHRRSCQMKQNQNGKLLVLTSDAYHSKRKPKAEWKWRWKEKEWESWKSDWMNDTNHQKICLILFGDKWSQSVILIILKALTHSALTELPNGHSPCRHVTSYKQMDVFFILSTPANISIRGDTFLFSDSTKWTATTQEERNIKLVSVIFENDNINCSGNE